MKKTLTNIILFVVLVVAVILLSRSVNNQAPVIENEPVTAYYTDGTSIVEALFVDDMVTFSEATLGTVTLPNVVAASGARYANEDESIVFWESEGELVILSEGEPLFQGTLTPTDTLALPSDAPEAILGTWVWTQTLMNDDSLTTPATPGAFTITLNADGSVQGTTDCNSFMGSYEADTSNFSFGALASTKMFCEGSQETTFTNSLANVGQYVFDENGNLVLNIMYDSGGIYFERQ